MNESLALRIAVALAGCVPVFAGGGGAVFGHTMLGAPWDAAADSHMRYLSGLLLGIGLGFWSTIPAVEHHTARFRLLTLIVVLGGLARLLGLGVVGWPGTAMAAALVMELVVTPVLCLWQARVARLSASSGRGRE